MITFLLVLSLFCKSTQDGNGQENGVFHCGPQNLSLTSSDQMLLLTWGDNPSCSALQDVLIYELVVLIADKKVHYNEVAVTPEQIGSAHSWKWISHLALQCATVKIRSRYNNHTSSWKQTLPESQSSNKKWVYPRDKVFEVGSIATFCCILPPGESFDYMYLNRCNGTNMSTTKIGNHMYTMTLHLNQASQVCDVECKTSRTSNGACFFIGYPPSDRDLQCETQDLESVECHWTVGRDTHLILKSPTLYHLLGRPCANGSMDRCSQKMQVHAGERNWTLKAENKLGTVELHDRADLTKRVHMFAPEGVTASAVNARNVSLEWTWTVQQYNDLNVTCQVNVSHGETSTTSENFGVGLNATVFKDLIPNWKYNVTLRCGTAQHFWKWGNWSKSVNFHTKGDVPDALDVWMQMKENQTVIIWKMPLPNQSHGDIINFEVAWVKIRTRDQENRTKVPRSNHSLALSVDTREEHIVTVTARNVNGSSSASTITIPSLSLDRTRVNTSWIIGSNGGFTLSWATSPIASCGYIVDWCPTFGNGTVEWLRVPPNKTHASIFSKDFKDGLRYSLSIYACTQGVATLLERREGYVRETRIEDELFKSLNFKQQDSDVVVSWDPIPLREQTAFIQGYILYYWDHNSTVFSVSTDNPEATSLTARNLKISSYTFTVTAQTAVGQCGNGSIIATLNYQNDNLIKSAFISLGAVFGLLSLTTIFCYRHWACIKQKVYPPIPKPVLTDKWLTSQGEHSCHCLRMDQSHLSETDILDIPVLHYKSGAPVNGYTSQEDMSFFTQTPIGYYNKPLKQGTLPPLILPATGVSSLSGLPSPLCSGVFPNPSYNLIMQTWNQQSTSGPEVQEGTPIMGSSNEYQPHSPTETFTLNQTQEDPDSPMSCVSTYILLQSST